MSKAFDFTTKYTLDKRFFEECYDQTSRPVKFPKAYFKAIFFLIFGVIVVKFDLLPNSYGRGSNLLINNNTHAQ